MTIERRRPDDGKSGTTYVEAGVNRLKVESSGTWTIEIDLSAFEIGPAATATSGS